MPGTLYGPYSVGYGSETDLWRILAGLQDRIDSIATGDSSEAAARIAGDTALDASKLPTTGNGLGGTTVSAQQLIDWTNGEAFEITSGTYDGNGILATAVVRWPDGSTGTVTVTATDVPSHSINAYTITHALSGKTVTQAAVTRNGSGAITVAPLLTVT